MVDALSWLFDSLTVSDDVKIVVILIFIMYVLNYIKDLILGKWGGR